MTSPEQVVAPAFNKPQRRTFFVADLKCYMCGATAGSIERERESNTPDILYSGRVRCPRCGGSVYVDQVEIVERRIEPIEWEDEGPRRGRPPKWLVEQRRRKRERELTAQVTVAAT